MVKQVLFSIVVWLRENVYAGPIKRFAVFLGIADLLKKIWTVFFMVLNDGELTSTVGETEATFHINSYPEYRRINSLIGERVAIRRLLEDLESDDVVYDIGANIGIYACFIARKDSEIRTVAFEPHSDNVQRLAKNLELNDDYWQCYQVALGGEDKMVPFQIASERPGESRHSVSDANTRIHTMQRKMDSLVREEDLEAPTVLKIDVEGIEYEVLRGAIETLSTVSVVYCEVHKEDSESSDVEQLLRDSGFQIEVLQEGAHTDHLRAVRA